MLPHRNSILQRPRRTAVSIKNMENIENEWTKECALQELKRLTKQK